MGATLKDRAMLIKYFHSSLFKIDFLKESPFRSILCDEFTYLSKIASAGVSDLSKTSVKVFPNTTTGSITICLGNEFLKLNLKLFDMNGKRVMQQKIINNKIVDIKQLTDGLYFYNIYGNNETMQSRKIIIRK